MNRPLVTVIALTGSHSRCADARKAQALGWQLVGKPAPVAYALGFGREGNDIHPSGEGHG